MMVVGAEVIGELVGPVDGPEVGISVVGDTVGNSDGEYVGTAVGEIVLGR